MTLSPTAHRSQPLIPPDPGCGSQTEAARLFCDGLQNRKPSQSLSRDSSVIYSLSLPVYSTPQQKVPGEGIYERRREMREGVGRCVWVDEEKRREEERENLRRKQHRVHVCMSRKDLVDHHLRDWGKRSLSIPQLDNECSYGCPGSRGRSWGPQATPGWRGSWGCCTRNPPPFSG